MSLIVEDGSKVDGAESYATTGQADTYLANRGVADWSTLSATEKEQALRRATDYMAQTFRNRWNGFRNSSTQALDWPRTYCPMPDKLYGESQDSWVADNIVPAEVRNACVELAYRAAAGELLTDLGREVKSESVSGAVAVTYTGGSRQTTFDAVNRLLEPYLSGGGLNSAPMARA